jgi:DNA-binding NtrC family response regulator
MASELRGGRLMMEDTQSLREKLGYSSIFAPASDALREPLREPHSLAESHLDAMAPPLSIPPHTAPDSAAEHDRLTPQLRSEVFWRSEVAGYAASLPPAPEMGMLLGEATEAVEAGLIAAVLENTRGNIAQSARLLGITRVSLRRKIQSFQLTVPGRPTLS